MLFRTQRVKEQASSRTGKGYYPTIIVSKIEQVQFTQSSFLTNKTLINILI